MNIHIVGIGGIGVSSLAFVYLSQGHSVTGSDLAGSDIIEKLKERGADIFTGKHNASLVLQDVDLVVYSPAVPQNNPELKQARKLQKKREEISIKSYPEALGELTKTHYTIAVCGTHGKSTTTAMIGLTLQSAGKDPTVIVGTKLKEYGDTNCRVGKSNILVIEADEHFASFLNYRPKIVVLTNLEPDHLDYYGSLKNLQGAFRSFVSFLPLSGTLIFNQDNPGANSIATSVKEDSRKKSFSLSQKEATILRGSLRVPGTHNVANALAALEVCKLLKIPAKTILMALATYKGSWRRFETFTKSAVAPSILVSDYGHHPTEIKATIEAARTLWPKKEIWLIFQPHQYQRTLALFDQFVQTLSTIPVDRVVLT
ncbi:MAG: UDP-N-acetylmuramate--L-alanine ligase, partial [bacterium]|nr:UDP-N-acetylmuramate--L-alanine ligase [bacterium]